MRCIALARRSLGKPASNSSSPNRVRPIFWCGVPTQTRSKQGISFTMLDLCGLADAVDRLEPNRTKISPKSIRSSVA